jgi:hypothetical protein
MNSENYSLDSLKKGCDSLNETLTQGIQDVEDQIRSTPLIAVALAAAGGYLLQFFPIFLILRLLMKLLFFLIKPAIVVLGAVKLYEFVRKQSDEIRGTGYAERDREPLQDSPSGPPQF